MPRKQFALTLRHWARASVNELETIRSEAAGLLGESLTVGTSYGPGTPVKTGRLLSGWTAEARDGQKTSVGTRGPEGDTRDRPDAQRARVPGWITRVRRMAKRKDIRIYTNVPYAIFVDEGHPTKRRFITRVRENWPRIVARARLIALRERKAR